MSDDGVDPVELVRRGYDALSTRYRSDDAQAAGYEGWIAELAAAVPAGGSVLDLGCGNGVPVARDLAALGLRVTGVDVSDVQVERARRLVPGATFLRADATSLDLPAGAFHAVVALYSIIHVPIALQPGLLRSVARWLVAGGTLLLTAGWDAWTGTEEGWLGGEASMWWSQADVATYRRWLTEAGLEVVREGFVPEGDGGHSLFWARRVESG
jgi:SAM-dependent methyltransferase